MRPGTPPTQARWQWLRSATVVAVGMAVMNVANYAFTLVAAHSLAPADFGALTALLGLVMIGGVPALGLQATGARRIATLPDGVQALAGTLLRAGRRTGVALGVLSVLGTPLLVWLLHIRSVTSVLLLAPTLALLTVAGAQLGVLQGSRRWREVAGVYAALGIGKLSCGAAGLLVRPDLLGAMTGLAVGTAAPVAVGGWLLRRTRSRPTGEVRRVFGEALHGAHLLLAFFAVANADVLLARNLLDADDSGIYAAGVVVAKACLFLPQFVVVVAFPTLARSPGDIRGLARAVAAVGGLGLCTVLGALLLPDLVVAVVGGAEYAAVGPVAWLFAVAGSAYAMLQLVVYAAIAQQERRAAPVVWAGLVLLVAVALFVVGRGAVTGTDGVRVLVAATSTCAVTLSALLATGLHRAAATPDRQSRKTQR